MKTYLTEDILSSSERKARRVPARTAFHWAFHFPMQHVGFLVVCGSVLSFVRLVSQWIVYREPLSSSQLFALSSFQLVAVAWLVTSIVMVWVETLRGRAVCAYAVGMRAMVVLPKVILSYAVLSILADLILRFASPLLLLGVLLLWTPLFAALDVTVERKPDEDDDSERDDEEVWQLYFSQRYLFDIGVVRSFYFAVFNIPLTFQLGLLLAFTKIVPLAVIGFLLPGTLGFAFPAFHSVVTGFLDVYVIAVGAAAFVFYLPVPTQRELGIEAVMREAGTERERAFPSLLRTGIRPLIVLFVCVGGALFYLADYQLREQAMPPSVQVQPAGTIIEGSSLYVRLRLDDSDYGFRWIQLAQFRGVFLGPKTESSQLTPPPGTKPRKVVVFSLDGSPLPPKGFAPAFEPVELRFIFPLAANVPEQGVVQITYPDRHGKERVIAEVPYRIDVDSSESQESASLNL